MTTQAEAPLAGRKEWIGLAVLLLPLLLVSMDVSVLYFAVPFISNDLHPTSTQQLWIFDVYGFVLAGLLITMGSLGDRIGRRRLLMIGAAAFGATSLAAAYAGSAEALIAARALLGIGGATLMPSTLALLRNMFHNEKQRATAVAIWTAALTFGISLGPILSGFLLEHFWWGSVFLINVPFMVLLVIVSAVIIALIVYTLTMDKVRSIATLKFVGAPDRTIVGLIVQQALSMGIFGYFTGLALVLIFKPYFPRRLVLDAEAVSIVFVITIVVCLLASTLGIRLALKVDPAEALASSG